MNTKEAIQAMLDGEKVRRKSWETNFFVHFNGKWFKDENDDVYHEFLEWDDWELYEEPKQTVVLYEWLICDGENSWFIAYTLRTEKDANYTYSSCGYKSWQKTGREFEVEL